MMTKMLNIAKVHAQFRKGVLTPTELVEQCLHVIDERESDVRAWVSVDRQGAMALAAQQTEQLASLGKTLPPLFGIPVGVKDLFDVSGWPTKAGSALLENNIAATDCTAVTRVKAAGGIFLGKTVTTQWASFDPSPTHNPWRIDRTPGGSSSGSAAAVAAGMCPIALGSQTGGSIVRPASYCGCVGFKPDFGRVPIDGVVPLAPTLDHVGGFARNVADVARLFSVLANDPSYLKLTPTDGPVRFGVVREFFGEQADAEAMAIFDAVLVHLENNVGSIETVELPVSIPDVVAWHRTIMGTECAHYHRENFAKHRATYSPRVSALIEEGLAHTEAELDEARRQAVRFRRLATTLLSEVDVLVTPSTNGPAPPFDTTGDARWQSPWSFSGLPTITIPCGLATLNLPLGLQLVALEESKLLAIAAQCEEALEVNEELARLMTI